MRQMVRNESRRTLSANPNRSPPPMSSVVCSRNSLAIKSTLSKKHTNSSLDENLRGPARQCRCSWAASFSRGRSVGRFLCVFFVSSGETQELLMRLKNLLLGYLWLHSSKIAASHVRGATKTGMKSTQEVADHGAKRGVLLRQPSLPMGAD